MEQLETIKGKSVVIPKIAKRYLVVYYNAMGWTSFHSMNFYTTPESALESFYDWASKIKEERVRPKYYKVVELDLEIPFIPELESCY